MKSRLGIKISTLFVTLIGIILLLTGLYITYGALTTSTGSGAPLLFAPAGVLVALIGILLLISREERA